MNVAVFVGPSLPPSAGALPDGFRRLPPAAQGDVYRVAREGPRIIGLIDGYFEGVPAVWHKEILWAMTQGVHVFGAASMGALRAAEMHMFGMRGAGWIFADFRDGVLRDDDEVAVRHGPEETGFLSVSVPMVNVRATLEQAAAAGVITPAAGMDLIRLAKQQFYQDRTWASLLEAARDVMPADAHDELERQIDSLAVDRKRQDALILIDEMARFAATDPGPMVVDYHFERTEMWINAPWLDETVSRLSRDAADGSAVLDELRLEGDGYRQLRERAVLQGLACGAIPAGGDSDGEVKPGQIATRMNEFRMTHGLMRRSQLDAWLRERDMTEEDLRQVLAREVRLAETARNAGAQLAPLMIAQLKFDGRYRSLAARARDKDDAVNRRRSFAGKVPVGLLVEWYFGEVLGRIAPSDRVGYAHDLDLDDLEAFHRLLRGEYHYRREGVGRSEGSEAVCAAD